MLSLIISHFIGISPRFLHELWEAFLKFLPDQIARYLIHLVPKDSLIGNILEFISWILIFFLGILIILFIIFIIRSVILDFIEKKKNK